MSYQLPREADFYTGRKGRATCGAEVHEEELVAVVMQHELEFVFSS